MLASSHTLSLREAHVSGVWAHLLPVEGEWGVKRAPGSCPSGRAVGPASTPRCLPAGSARSQSLSGHEKHSGGS